APATAARAGPAGGPARARTPPATGSGTGAATPAGPGEQASHGGTASATRVVAIVPAATEIVGAEPAARAVRAAHPRGRRGRDIVVPRGTRPRRRGQSRTAGCRTRYGDGSGGRLDQFGGPRRAALPGGRHGERPVNPYHRRPGAAVAARPSHWAMRPGMMSEPSMTPRNRHR